MYSPQRVCEIVTAVAALHNICNKLRIPFDEQEVRFENENETVDDNVHGEELQDGITVRNQVALRLYNRDHNN